MAKIKIIRDTFSDESTIGKLYIDGEYFCETLEDKDRKLERYLEPYVEKDDLATLSSVKVYGKTCIPRGRYRLDISMSNRFNKLLPILSRNKPFGFEGIRIHAGNTAADTDGCILLGRTRRRDFIENSRDAFNELMNRLEEAIESNEKIEIEIV